MSNMTKLRKAFDGLSNIGRNAWSLPMTGDKICYSSNQAKWEDRANILATFGFSLKEVFQPSETELWVNGDASLTLAVYENSDVFSIRVGCIEADKINALKLKKIG
jgi:hypothetical protein